MSVGLLPPSFFFSSRRRHTRWTGDWSSDVCSSDLLSPADLAPDRTVVTTALSKSLALGGWRIGVARMPSGRDGTALRDRLIGIGSELWSTPSNPVQQAAAYAFAEPAVLAERVSASRRLHARMAQAVAARFAAAGAQV